MDLYPLVFEPLLKRRIWGGQRLAAWGKVLPGDEPIGESWELTDLEQDQSVVRSGPARGQTLGALVKEHGADLLGDVDLFEGRFPLLIKFLDAARDLSVQVHPDEAMAQRLGGSVRVKNEAWYVLQADPAGAIYCGLVEGADRDRFAAAVEQGRVVEMLRRVPVKAGQCYYLPSGTVHALGAGVVVAEIQTPSDTTYRVYDWDRVDAATGQPRELHVAEALECIHFDEAPPAPPRSHVASVWTSVTRLAACDSFIIERVRMAEGFEQELPYDGMVVWMVLEGRVGVTGSGASGAGEAYEFTVGDVVLWPAAMRAARIAVLEPSMWLEVTVPVPSNLPERSQLGGMDLTSTQPPLHQIEPPPAPEGTS
ncbi:MAG: class I mannose-6-phosphate isomerase [bacterium]|nr:class I mannose-6-phosphate isomerase [bacterium]